MSWRLSAVKRRYDMEPPAHPVWQPQEVRRIFRREGIYRIAVAITLVRDGFAPEFVGRVLNYLDEGDFEQRDEEGNFLPVGGILLVREPKGSRIDFFAAGKPPEMKAERYGPYYALDLSWIVADVNGRIKQRASKVTEGASTSEGKLGKQKH